MSIRRRKKAISKVVKLLNLATSSNPSEATMALRHAETIVRQNSISRSEVPLSALCDPITLNKVKWGAKTQSTYTPKYARTSSAASQQFNETPVDKTHTYAGARTILDEEYVSEPEFDPIKEAARENEEREAAKLRKKAERLNAEKARKAAELKEQAAQKAAKEKAEKERLKVAAELQAERERQEIERYAAQAKLKMEHEQAELAKKNAAQNLLDDVQNDEIKTDEVLNENEGMEIDEQVEAPHDIPKESEQMKAETVSADTDVSSSASLNTDNVINAASAFRPEGVIFSKQLKDQYAASDPTVPFEEDEYWQKVAAQLAGFDESEIQLSIETIEKQLVLSKESLAEKRQSRLDAEQEELNERQERARIELSFEEAIERAFQARAKAYEAWEKQKSEIRVECLRSEQEAQHGYEELTQDLDRVKADFQQHVKRKQDFHAAKIMHELRCHLALAVSVSGKGKDSFDKVVTIMSEAGLTLKDLEFSDIKNKSLFIRLLERETASIEDVVARESHTEEMLSKFLSSTLTKREPVKTENPLQQIEKLLGAASLGSQFEAQKSIEQTFHLMELHGISVRDIDLTKITKYSVFVRLLNWEAEKIPSLTEREKFTASILEEYVTSSIHGDAGVRDKVSKNKA